MTHADEQELQRLTGLLKSIGTGFEGDQDCREALQKAALALTVAFSHGLRAELENWYAGLGTPLSADERGNLRQHDIDPDTAGNG